MKKILLILLLCIINLYAYTTEYGRVCMTNDDFKAYVNGDGNIKKQLISNGDCFYVESGKSCSILDAKMWGASKLRIYMDGRTYNVWGRMDVCPPK